ncbi:MAG: hypothetical protein K8W52_29125, partial [Deltaproteobacteria bacterium]|nr:hypothetical protein [Deltaproteobacteria bacterium]
MITFLPRRISASMIVATAIATTAWWARAAMMRDSPGASEVHPTAAGVLANPPDEEPAGPCLVPRPPSGIYVLADDDPIEVAVVDGCVAAAWPRVSARDDLAPQWGAVVAPQLPGVTATDDQREVVLRPDLSHIARAGDGLVLAVADDGALTVFTRGSQMVRWVSPGRALHRIAVLEDRRGARDRLLAHSDPTVAAAALTRAMQSPDADDCRAISAWLDRSRDAHHRDLITSALDAANAPCLVPAIRRALDEPALIGVASRSLARLASPDEKAE